MIIQDVGAGLPRPLTTRQGRGNRAPTFKKNGAILLVALIALVSLSLFGAALVSMVFWRSEMMELEYDRLRAFYLAEAGISSAFYELKTDFDSDGDGVGNVSQKAFGGGMFEADYRPIQRTITAQGTFNDTTRTIQIVFAKQT